MEAPQVKLNITLDSGNWFEVLLHISNPDPQSKGEHIAQVHSLLAENYQYRRAVTEDWHATVVASSDYPEHSAKPRCLNPGRAPVLRI